MHITVGKLDPRTLHLPIQTKQLMAIPCKRWSDFLNELNKKH